jgi:hypothetical protein
MTWLLSLVLLLGPASVSQARCYNVGTPQFRCDPIVSQALRQRIEPRLAYQLPLRSRFELNTYTAATGATRRTYRYRDGHGHERRGTLLELPGTVRIRETERR